MTIKEIAKLANVSISTVSKIVNNKDEGINPQTRSRVLKIVKEYNYTPYGTVKSISNAKKFLLGVLLSTTSRSNLLISGILQAAQAHGYTILLLDSQNSSDTELKHVTALCSNNVDGVIWEPVSPESYQLRQSFDRQNIPFCLIGNGFPCPSYWIDFTQLGYTLTQKLIDYKHATPACLLKEGSQRSAAFFEGFQKCLYDNQIPFTNDMKLCMTEKDCCQKILDHNITGIVSSHFSLSLSLFEQMSRLHYYMPSDFSLVSLKGDVEERLSYPLISGIRIPYFEFGQHVTRQLINMCEKSAEYEPEYLFSPTVDFDNEGSLDRPAPLRAKSFVVVGALNLDVTFNVDELPQHGKTTNILNFTSTAGGKGTNQSVGVAKLGHEVALIGETGADADSAFLFDTLEKAHVVTFGVHRNKRRQTGKAYIYTEPSGESAISVLFGANAALTPKDIEKRQYLFNHAGYCLISTEIPTETALRAAQLAKSYGAATIVKPAVRAELPEELLINTDFLIPNRKEAAALCPMYDTVQEQAEFFLQSGVGTVIITLGHDGCYLRTPEREEFFPASMDFLAVDTTAGADAFISALASYLTDGYSLEKSIRIATYAAGFCISKQGAASALVDKNTLESYIAKREASLLE